MMYDGVKSCQVCSSQDLLPTVVREHLPAMQNYVYRSLDKAVRANIGKFRLDYCRTCGFAFNAFFDPALLDYDEGYDNTVPSRVMTTYYQELANYLHEKYLPEGGLLLDIGCGKGTFLETMTQTFPDTEGLGIDPAYEGPERSASLRLRFIRECFAAHHVDRRPNLVICRHVVEHMSPPVEFLKSLRSAMQAYPDVPFFVEVPDLSWIIENQAFWDFCYEHCSFFTPCSLTNAMTLSGFRTVCAQTGFGGQYIWLEAFTETSINASLASPRDAPSRIHRLQEYTQNEWNLIQQARVRLTQLKQDSWEIVLWGMASKGILFSHLVDSGRTLFDHCIDINPNKQGCFTPVTGHAICSPDMLTSKLSNRIAIVVMNTNYLAEVVAACRDRGLSPLFLNAYGETLTMEESSS